MTTYNNVVDLLNKHYYTQTKNYLAEKLWKVEGLKVFFDWVNNEGDWALVIRYGIDLNNSKMVKELDLIDIIIETNWYDDCEDLELLGTIQINFDHNFKLLPIKKLLKDNKEIQELINLTQILSRFDSIYIAMLPTNLSHNSKYGYRLYESATSENFKELGNTPIVIWHQLPQIIREAFINELNYEYDC